MKDKTVPDIKVVGPPDLFRLASKASSEEGNWMKSTKVANTPEGCLVQVTTQQGNNIAEALTFCPRVRFDFEMGEFRST